MAVLWQDLRYGFRESSRQPAFSLLAILTLALGIGAVTMMYSVIYSVLFNPFPYTDPRSMVDVVIRDLDRSESGIRGALTIAEFRTVVDESRVFEDAVGTNTTGMLYRTNERTQQFTVAELSPNSFRFLGVPALIGRTWTDDDLKRQHTPVAVLSHKTWVTYFSADPGIVGRNIELDKRVMTVIGVMPPRFTWNVADVWIPDRIERGDPDGRRKAFWLQGRLKRGISIPQAEAELNTIGLRLAQQFPDRFPKRFRVEVITVIDWVVGKFRRVLYTLLGAVGLLLVIACCNVANMLLARASSREREISIRAALGATRSRIVRQLLSESLLLALSGAALGVALAYAATGMLRKLIPPNTIPVETVIEIQMPVLLATLGIAILTALLFGLAPAFHTTRVDLARGLAASGKGADSGSRLGTLRTLLVIAEIALPLVLLTGAGMLMRSFLSMTNVDLGFNPHNLLVARMMIPNATPEQRRQFFDAAMRRLGTVPGVKSVGVTTSIPPYGGGRTDIELVGTSQSERAQALFQLCNEGYFATVGYPLLSGRILTDADIASSRGVAVVNRALARKYFGNDNPLGRQIRLLRLPGLPQAFASSTFEIVGVVENVRNQGLEQPAAPEAYVPYSVTGMGYPGILLRTSIDPKLMTNTIRNQIHTVNANVVQRDPIILDDFLRDRSYARPRFSVLLMSVFAAIGLVLVGTGVYGVMAYVVSQRMREFGIRIALGAGGVHIFESVVVRAAWMIGAGAAVGVVASFATNKLISHQIWSVARFDGVALASSIAVIVVLGLGACCFPALRAMRADAGVVLREE